MKVSSRRGGTDESVQQTGRDRWKRPVDGEGQMEASRRRRGADGSVQKTEDRIWKRPADGEGQHMEVSRSGGLQAGPGFQLPTRQWRAPCCVSATPLGTIVHLSAPTDDIARQYHQQSSSERPHEIT